MASGDDEPAPHVSYNRQYRRCCRPGCPSCSNGQPGHGPYWYAHWREGDRVRSRYLGKRLPPGVVPPASAAASPTPGTAAVPIVPCGAVRAVSRLDDDLSAHDARAPRMQESAPIVPDRSRRPVRPPSGSQSAGVPAAPALRVCTLGTFEVWRGEDMVLTRAWHQHKVAALFKCLLAAPGYQLPRDRAIDLLWPEAHREAGAKHLSVVVHRLRRVLQDPVSAEIYLYTEGDLLCLRPAGRASAPAGWLDAEAFEQAASREAPLEDLAACREAAALYTGEYLPGDPYDDWAVDRRETLRLRYLELLLHVADLAGAQGESGEAEQILRTVLRLDPCHEEAAARLLSLLAASGRRTEALRVYAELAVALARELGARPSADLAALRARLLAQEAVPAAAAQPPRNVAVARRTNVPQALTSFVGRLREQDHIRRLLAETRLLTLTGAGGCGKTRLALQTADDLVGSYSDGVWLVELAALPADANEGALVRGALATALAVREQPGEPLMQTLGAFLAPRHLLLVLDNCEHVLAPCAALVAGLLAACPHLKVLATSRERLGVPGERFLSVPALSVPPPGFPPEDLARFESAMLFMERAQVHQPLPRASAAAIARICARLAGIPLAIELAAARAHVLPVQTLADRLEESFRVLGTGPRTALPRQRTLHATLDWSYALLDERERQLLRRLAVFADGWALEAAETVCALPAAPNPGRQDLVSAEAVLALLGGLVGKSLVQIEASRDEPRYRFLEPVRQYAAEHLRAAGEQETLCDRHLDWCLALAEQAEPALQGPEHAVWLARLEVEHDNCRAALRWSHVSRRTDRGLRLACALRAFWDVRGHRAEGYAWLDTLLRAADAVPAVVRPIRARALVASAVLAYAMARYEEAVARAEQGRALCRELADDVGLGDALNVLGMTASDRGDYVSAAQWYTEALDAYRSAGRQGAVAASLCNLANVAYFQADFSEAIARYEDATDTFRALDDVVLLALNLSNLGSALIQLGDLDRAEEVVEEGLHYARQSGAVNAACNALVNLASVACLRKRYVQAAELAREALRTVQESGDQRTTLVVLSHIAEIMAHLGQARCAAMLGAAVLAYAGAVGIGTTSDEWRGVAVARDIAQAALGAAGAAAAEAKGRHLTLDETIALALAPQPAM